VGGVQTALVKHFKELRVYQQVFAAATRIYKSSKSWPKEERYSLTTAMHKFAPGFHYLVILSRSAAEAKNPVFAFQERDSSAFGLRMTNTILGMYLRIGVLTDQIRRSSRSVCANIAEAWRTLSAS
jgi:hypothetical protein